MINNQKKVRVLHVLANLNLGGAESRMVDIYRSQGKGRAINDFVIMTDESCYFSEEILQSGGVIHIIPNPRLSLIKNIMALYRLLKKKPQYNAIHAHTSYYSGFAVFIAFLAGVPARVAHARNKGLGTENMMSKILHFSGRLLCRYFATKRLAISTDAGAFLYGVNDKFAFEVVPNAFNFDLIKHKKDARVHFSQKSFEIKTDVINIVCVARFCSVKNHKFLLNIASLMKNKNIPFCLHLIGDGELKSALELQIDTLQLNQNVKFWGKRQDIPNLLGLFDVMVMTSLSEGLGVAALEAQAAGLACVLSSSIPKEVDIGLGLCKFVNLNEGFEQWEQAISMSSSIMPPSKAFIDHEFMKKGYALESTRKKYIEAYGYYGED
jgi:glycosyltransferase involved in cell wall biosynthesis